MKPWLPNCEKLAVSAVSLQVREKAGTAGTCLSASDRPQRDTPRYEKQSVARRQIRRTEPLKEEQSFSLPGQLSQEAGSRSAPPPPATKSVLYIDPPA